MAKKASAVDVPEPPTADSRICDALASLELVKTLIQQHAEILDERAPNGSGGVAWWRAHQLCVEIGGHIRAAFEVFDDADITHAPDVE